jgi:hypothetical protein
MKYAIIHITFEHEKRVDDIIDKMITDNIGHLLDSNEYWGSETELETMAKTSDYVLQFNEDVAHIVDDYLYDMISLAIKYDAEMSYSIMDERDARECGYVIGSQF